MNKHFQKAFAAMAAAKPASGFRPETEVEWVTLQKAQEEMGYAMLLSGGKSESEARALARAIYRGPAGPVTVSTAGADQGACSTSHTTVNVDAKAASYDLKAHLHRALPYLCKLADAINDAGFLGVHVYQYWSLETGLGCSFRVDPNKLAGNTFEGIWRDVAAGGCIPPTMSVLIQLEAANSAFEQWADDDKATTKEGT